MLTSAINEPILKKALLASATDKWAQRIMKIKNGSGILFPYFDTEGMFLDYRLRLDKPVLDTEGKVLKKYHQNKGTSLTCYFIKDTVPLLQDASTPLLITEGEKKMLSLASNLPSGEYAPISYPGVWNFKAKGENRLSEVWNNIPMDKREVYWIPDTDIFTNPNVAQAGKLFLNLLVNSGATVHIIDLRKEGCEDKIGADDFISKFSLKELIERVNNPISVHSKYNNVFEFIDNPPITESNIIFTNATIRRKELLSNIRDKLSISPDIFKYGSSLIQIKDLNYEVINSYNISSVMSDLDIEFASGSKDRPIYKLMPPDLARTFVFSNFSKTGYKEITLFSDHPVYTESWNLSNAGYNDTEKTYYAGADIQPVRSLDLIETITKEFLFKNRASLCNYIALLLTSILRNKYRGDRPFGAFSGNRPQIGKTLSCKLLSIVATGKTPETITYTRDQIELEKQIGARISKNDVLLIDNVKSQIPVESSVLEKLITDDPVSFRELGTSNTITKPNTLITLVTMNDAIFCQDLISRALPIEFFLDDATDPSAIQYENDNLCSFTQSNRSAIIQELCGMVEVWKDKGSPVCEEKFRFRRWSQEIGGILMANGFIEFLDNLETASALYDKYLHDLGVLFEDILNQDVTAMALLEICEIKGLFSDIRSVKKAPIAMSHMLSRYIGRKIPLTDGKSFILKDGRWDSHRKLKTYIAEQKS
jgi:hypothetical protein